MEKTPVTPCFPTPRSIQLDCPMPFSASYQEPTSSVGLGVSTITQMSLFVAEAASVNTATKQETTLKSNAKNSFYLYLAPAY